MFRFKDIILNNYNLIYFFYVSKTITSFSKKRNKMIKRDLFLKLFLLIYEKLYVI